MEEKAMNEATKQANDQPVLGHIQRLVDEEHQLYSKGGANTDQDVERLKSIQVELDQCWDLLRQRRARREFGQNPEKAQVRPPDVVENYEG
jgi:hypothetical protein